MPRPLSQTNLFDTFSIESNPTQLKLQPVELSKIDVPLVLKDESKRIAQLRSNSDWIVSSNYYDTPSPHFVTKDARAYNPSNTFYGFPQDNILLLVPVIAGIAYMINNFRKMPNLPEGVKKGSKETYIEGESESYLHNIRQTVNDLKGHVLYDHEIDYTSDIFTTGVLSRNYVEPVKEPTTTLTILTTGLIGLKTMLTNRIEGPTKFTHPSYSFLRDMELTSVLLADSKGAVEEIASFESIKTTLELQESNLPGLEKYKEILLDIILGEVIVSSAGDNVKTAQAELSLIEPEIVRKIYDKDFDLLKLDLFRVVFNGKVLKDLTKDVLQLGLAKLQSRLDDTYNLSSPNELEQDVLFVLCDELNSELRRRN